ncbi:MAG: glycosyl hydrolase family 18 protein [Cellulosilyticaceae bacterium]
MKKVIRNLLIACMSIVALVALAVFIYKEMPNGNSVDPLAYFDEFKEGQNNMVFEDKRVPFNKPIQTLDGITYVSYEVVKEFIDPTIFYDKNEKIVTITNLKEVIRIPLDSDKITINGRPGKIEEPIKFSNEMAYLPLKMLENRYNFVLEKGVDERLYIGYRTDKDREVYTVNSKKSALRTHPDKKQIVVEKLEKGNKVTVYSQEKGYARVMSENGIIGYIKSGNIEKLETIPKQEVKKKEPAPTKKPLNEKVRLVWDQLTVRTAGLWDTPKYAGVKDANVISPTWFEFGDAKGNLLDRGTKEYVDSAHARGLLVWPLMSHSFTTPKWTYSILPSTENRQRVIDQLIAAANQYGFDGINIDIENVQVETSEGWIQFMRELYPLMKEKGLTVTVDVYMPSDWSGHYEREEVGKLVDYFMVMAYDQHWSGSEEAGPVAGLDWVEEGIKNNLKEVPKEKLVLGMPFYTRIWEESQEGLRSSAYSMEATQKIIKKWGVMPTFDEITKQYYAETQKNNTTYKVWVEDAESIGKRIDIVNTYDLAGYGAWKLGLETSKTWDSLNQIKE